MIFHLPFLAQNLRLELLGYFVFYLPLMVQLKNLIEYRIPNNLLMEDEVLLQFYDIASSNLSSINNSRLRVGKKSRTEVSNV